jgi:hypothetical protein
MTIRTNTSSRIHFQSAGAPRRPSFTKPIPLAQASGSGFVPVIYHPDRGAEYLRVQRFPRKAKATGAEAYAYAARVIWYRQTRAAEKHRRIIGLSHPRFHFFLQAAE